MIARLSIKTRLLLGVALGQMLLFGGLLWMVQKKAIDEASELLDGDLVGTTRVAVQIASAAPFNLTPAPAMLARDPYESPRVIEFWSRNGELLSQIGSVGALTTAPRNSGFADHRIGGRAWRAYASLNQAGTVWVRTLLPADSGAPMVRDLVQHFLRVALIAVAVLIALLWLFVWYLLRPLDAFTAAIERTPINQIGEVALPPTASELHDVIDALNSLVGRVRTERDVERAFIADAAHELRTPLAGIQLHAQNALAETDPARLRRALGQIELGCRRAAHVVSQLLGLAKYDATRRLALVPVGVDALIRRTLPAVVASADLKNVEIVTDAARELYVYGDAAALELVLRNLLLNAIQYSPEGKPVRIEARDLGRYVEISVADSGPGVPRESRLIIFERFARLPDGAPGGSGLGLSIVRRILSLHRGRISVNNAASGGAVFTIRLRSATTARGPNSIFQPRSGAG